MDSRALVSCLVLVLAVCGSESARGGVLKVPQQFATINDAVTAAGSGDTVLVSKGTYVGNVFVDAKTNVTLRAKGKVRVRGTPAITATVFVNACNNFVMRGFRIEPAGTDTGILASFGSHVTLDRCRIDGGGTAIHVDLSADATVRRCIVNDPSQTAIIVKGDNAAILGCKVTRTAGDGISFESANAQVIGNKLTHIGDDAISPSDADGALIADNKITDVVEVAMGASPTLIATIVGNKVNGAGLGIECDGNVLLIQNNSFRRIDTSAIKAVSGSTTTVRNRFDRCGTSIEVGGGASESVHSENVIRRSTANGVELKSGAKMNSFTRNVARQSGGFDLFDESGQTNLFIGNSFQFIGP